MSRVQLAPGHGREYETIYILRPNTEREIADGVANRVSDAIKSEGGLLTQAELWGSRRLAYPIRKHYRGTYVYLKYVGKGGTVGEIERQLRLADPVIRFQTIQLRDNVPMEDVKVDEDELKLDFNLPFEADEPELTRERELGLDNVGTDRRRGRRDDDRGRNDDKGDDDKAKAKSDDDDKAKGDDKAKSDDKAKAKAKAKSDDDGKAKAKSDDDDKAKSSDDEEEE